MVTQRETIAMTIRKTAERESTKMDRDEFKRGLMENRFFSNWLLFIKQFMEKFKSPIEKRKFIMRLTKPANDFLLINIDKIAPNNKNPKEAYR
jgi:myosin-crossreactive antigen